MSPSNSSVSLEKSSVPPPLPVDKYGNPLPQLLDAPRYCGVDAGFNWMFAGFKRLIADFWVWTVIDIIFIIAILFVGYKFFIIWPFLVAGMMYGCETKSRGNNLRLNHLFVGFEMHLKPLAILSLIYIAGIICSFVPSFIFGLLLFGTAGSFELSQLSFKTIFMILLPFLLSLFIWSLSIRHASALIIIHNLDILSAVKRSIKGIMLNLIPIFIYCMIISIPFIFFVLVTLGIGILILPIFIPISILSSYVAYRDIWTDQPLSANA